MSKQFPQRKEATRQVSFKHDEAPDTLGKLANIKHISADDLLLVHFTAMCDNEVHKKDILKIKDITWNLLKETMDQYEAASLMDSVISQKDKLFQITGSRGDDRRSSSSGISSSGTSFSDRRSCS